MFKWLLYFDFLKKPYEFKLNYNQKNGTVIGGLLSIISGSILLLYFVVSYMTIDSQNIQIAYGKNKIIVNEEIDQYKFIFSLGITIFDDQGKVIFCYLFSFIQIQYYTYQEIKRFIEIKAFSVGNQLDNLLSQELEINDCDDQHNSLFQSQADSPNFEEEQKQKLNHTLCLKSNFTIKGQKQSKGFQQLTMLVSQCSQGCADQNEIDNFLKRMELQIYSLSNVLLLTPDFQPYQQNYTSQVNQLSLNQNLATQMNLELQIIDFYIKKTSILTAEKFLEKIQTGVQLKNIERRYDNYLDRIALLLNQTQSLLTINFNLHQEILNLESEQELLIFQILDCLSLFGGLFTTFFTILQIAYKYYQRHIQFLHLINHNLIFDLENLQQNSSYFKSIKINNVILQNFQFHVHLSYLKYLLIRLKLKLNNCIKKQHYYVEPEFMVIQQAIHLIQKKLDLTHILEKFFEIEKIKMMLMDHQQLVLFNSLAKPVIQLSKRRKKRKNEHIYRSISQRKGLGKSMRQENKGSVLIKLFQQIQKNENKYHDNNPKFLKILKMNKKIYKVLKIHSHLVNYFTLKKKIKLNKNDQSKGKLLWFKAIGQIFEMMAQNKLQEFINNLGDFQNSQVIKAPLNENNKLIQVKQNMGDDIISFF